ncbi:hypothetical protein QUW38_02030 [Clostridium butyricum]|uniref:hypothetical protein n=1 Tax=Clostridium butyricum TaxID=1492 RepID=UPI0025A3B4B0|nr:hypothetical protein [Clostridium butyricum]MDM8130093.1 hypothetical protein [Clostridium butyricum]MDM8228220.1 hypothetical protein [Clostridium butyricum]
MKENIIEVYIRLSENNIITDIESSISSHFIDFTNKWILLDKGWGDKYAHAQNMYLDESLRDDLGRFNYKYENGEVVELTEDEKLNLFPVREKGPTETEILQKQLLETQAIVANLQEQILLNQNGGK